MSLRFFLGILGFLFFLSCNNVPLDLSSYKKYSYFDELMMKGVGFPSNEQLLRNEYVYVKVINKQINIYYPSKEKEIIYRMLDSLWFTETKVNSDIYAEKNIIKKYSNAKGVVIVQEYFNQLEPMSFISIHTKDDYYGFKCDSIVVISKEKYDTLIMNFNYEICNFYNLKSETKFWKKYYYKNYILFYKVSRFSKNGVLDFVIKREDSFDFDFSDVDSFLKKYPNKEIIPNIR